jgi:hypothetical protein
MEERLRTVLGTVSEWLKFAEAKLAALVVVNGAAVFGAAQILGSLSTPEWRVNFYLWSFIVLASLAGVVALVGILPKTALPWIRSTGKSLQSDNLLFFGHIEKYRPDEYLRALAEVAGEAEGTRTPLERQYAEQIIINSRIASTKYTLFRWAAWITLSAVLTPILAIPLLWFLVTRAD